MRYVRRSRCTVRGVRHRLTLLRGFLAVASARQSAETLDASAPIHSVHLLQLVNGGGSCSWSIELASSPAQTQQETPESSQRLRSCLCVHPAQLTHRSADCVSGETGGDSESSEADAVVVPAASLAASRAASSCSSMGSSSPTITTRFRSSVGSLHHTGLRSWTFLIMPCQNIE